MKDKMVFHFIEIYLYSFAKYSLFSYLESTDVIANKGFDSGLKIMSMAF